jgi:four helix bundle protein
MAHNFKDLKIWQEAMKVVKSTYLLTAQLPLDERFGLISQINRSAVSIPSNIAEGSGRTTDKDFLNFINISLSSSFELETQLILANDLFQLDVKDLIIKINELQRMIVGFKKSISSKLNNNKNEQDVKFSNAALSSI